MGVLAADPEQIRSLPQKDRLEKLAFVFKNEPNEAARWDAVWLAGELAEETNLKGPIFEQIGELYNWIMRNDDNSVVRHEVCYQIAGRNMRKQIPVLLDAALHDESDLVRHEAIECLSIIRADDEIVQVIKKGMEDPSKIVRDTAVFVQKRIDRVKGKEYDRMLGSF